MITTITNVQQELEQYITNSRISPLFMLGDSLEILRQIPDEIFDCVMTSPPYWGKREYNNGGIGLEADFRQFIDDLAKICVEAKRVLKPTGSFGSILEIHTLKRNSWVSHGDWQSNSQTNRDGHLETALSGIKSREGQTTPKIDCEVYMRTYFIL